MQKMLKKTLTLFAFLAVFATQAFATYIVVLRDGGQYKAKQKWTIVNGKAVFTLESGQSMSLDPALIDAAKSEQTTKMNLGNAQIVDLNPNLPEANRPATQPSLGSRIKLRQPAQNGQPATPAPATSPSGSAPAVAPPPVVGANGNLAPEIVEKFERAYDNVGIFERKLTATGPHSLRVELTADSEDKVFNAISATSFLIMRVGTVVPGAQVDLVELYMKTTTGGAAGRFRMSQADAEALDSKKLTQQEYFVRNVIY